MRLLRAKEELAAKDEFDAVVINDDIDLALLELKKIIET
jgi:guanylate kinase